MAKTSSGCLLMLCLALLVVMAAATQFRVGGSKGWTVPTDPNTMSYNQWAERNRFQIGDSLLFVYQPDSDSVLQVSQEAYNTCNTSSYIQRFDDGNTVFAFDRSGPFYFISGVENNCLRNESLIVVVLADRKNSAGLNQPQTVSPSPSPTPISSPLTSPPLPPPSATPSEISPSRAPTGGKSSPPPPPNNGASLNVVGFMGSVGALLGSLFLVL